MARTNDQTRKLRNAIVRRTSVFVALFTLLYFLFFVFFDNYLKPALSNYLYNEFLGGLNYPTYNLITNPYLLVVLIGYAAGLFLIIRSGINRSLHYFDTLFSSIENILGNKEEAISLPSELSQTALTLNTIKETSRRNEIAARAAEQRKNELVVYLAHDIKTPLTSIIGYLTLLSESPEMPLETRARYAGIGLEKAYRLEGLIEEFFEITRYNLQTIPIERTRFDATLFCQQVIDDLYPQMAARSLTLNLEAPDAVPVFADANRLARVLNNVLKNAIAYADEESDIILQVENCLLAKNKRWLKIMVTNKGSEITPQHLERIFEKFYRGEEARSSNSGGSGLGLAIAREIARAHGGDITAASTEGITSFAIWIPQDESEAKS